MHTMYDQATTSVQISGVLAGTVSIQSGIRQGCPLSMVLYPLCLDPLIRSLEENLSGLQLGRSHQFVLVLAYADDVTVFVTQPAAFAKVHQAIRCFEKAIGARLNPTKSKALAVGAWTEPVTMLGIELHDRVDILEVTFGPTLVLSVKDSWTGVVRTVRTQSRTAYARNFA